MQTLEDSKQFVDILHVEADAVVSNHEYRLPILFLWLATDFDDGASAGAGELKRVSQQGLKDLPEQNGIALHRPQSGANPLPFPPFSPPLENGPDPPAPPLL